MVDVLEVRRSAFVSWPGGGGFQPYELRVNGRPLIDIVREHELPFAEREHDERVAAGKTESEVGPRGSLAGSYLYLPSSLVFPPSENLLGKPYEHGFVLAPDDPRQKMSLLLQCTCGITECWFLLARIEVARDRVTWSDFRQFHRDWDYNLGPFVFDRDEYLAALHDPR
jgi:hypothetical protein